MIEPRPGLKPDLEVGCPPTRGVNLDLDLGDVAVSRDGEHSVFVEAHWRLKPRINPVKSPSSVERCANNVKGDKKKMDAVDDNAAGENAAGEDGVNVNRVNIP